MAVRSASKNRCEFCRMYRPLCICSHIPRFNLQTKFLILMHWREEKLTTNTAHLARLALPNCEILIRGRRDQPSFTESFIRPIGTLGLLYPSDDAIELNKENIQALAAPLTLIVPDGSWRQAKKVSSREGSLRDITRFKLPPGPPSTYRLRHSPHEENLSTFEAIARAIGILENQQIQKRLEDLFLMMVERTLWSRGKLSARNCTTEIPAEAFEISRLAGITGRKV